MEDERETELSEDDDEEYDSGGSGVALTPPDSPGMLSLMKNENRKFDFRSRSTLLAKERFCSRWEN